MEDLVLAYLQPDRTEAVASELCDVIRQITVGLCQRHNRDLSEDEQDDATQEAVIACLHGVTKFDFSRGSSLFGYLTTIAHNEIRKVRRINKKHAHEMLEEEYDRHL